MGLLTRYVVFHSKEWETLVATGWLTMSTEYVRGVQFARMVYHPR
jgi:hypothetical protein